MAPPTRTLFIEGTFAELALQLAQFLVSLKQDDTTLSSIESLVEKKPEEALKTLVEASVALNSASEKDILPAYNLLIHLVQGSESSTVLFTQICQNLTQPIPSANGTAIALSVLSSIFNLFPTGDVARYQVLLSSIKVVRSTSSFNILKPQLKQIPTWLKEWQLNEQDERSLYLAIYEAAQEADDKDALTYLLSALRTFPTQSSSDPTARELSIKALKSALLNPTVYDFSDITALDTIHALRETDTILFELLDIFVGQNREEFDAFLVDNPGWLEQNGFAVAILERKINQLTLASLAASASQSRSLPYEDIAKALKVEVDDVEMWVIDVIRAGLVEGKLSQSNKMLLVHRTTYRTFGDKQWQEVASRLDTWRSSLTNVLQVLRAERVNLATSIEQAEAEAKTYGSGGQRDRRGGANRGGRRDNRSHHNNSGNDDGNTNTNNPKNNSNGGGFGGNGGFGGFGSRNNAKSGGARKDITAEA